MKCMPGFWRLAVDDRLCCLDGREVNNPVPDFVHSLGQIYEAHVQKCLICVSSRY